MLLSNSVLLMLVVTSCPVPIHSGSFCSVHIIKAGLFYAISHQRDLNIYNTFRIYAIILGLTRVGLEDSWPHLSSVGGYQNMESRLRHQSCVRFDYFGGIITRLM